MVESALSYSTRFSLQEIDWDTPDQEYIAESDEDRELLSVSAFSYTRGYPETKVLVTEDALAQVVQLAPEYDDLRIAKAFWREGMGYFMAFRYVQAFYQFYFVIEDFFAGGKSGKKGVMGAFHKSAGLMEHCTNYLDRVEEDARHWKSLKEHFGEFKCAVSPQGLAELLFEMRGALHHYSRHSQRSRGTPFNQSDYETISLVAMQIATSGIAYREVEISNSISKPKSSTGNR